MRERRRSLPVLAYSNAFVTLMLQETRLEGLYNWGVFGELSWQLIVTRLATKHWCEMVGNTGLSERENDP